MGWMDFLAGGQATGSTVLGPIGMIHDWLVSDEAARESREYQNRAIDWALHAREEAERRGGEIAGDYQRAARGDLETNTAKRMDLYADWYRQHFDPEGPTGGGDEIRARREGGDYTNAVQGIVNQFLQDPQMLADALATREQVGRTNADLDQAMDYAQQLVSAIPGMREKFAQVQAEGRQVTGDIRGEIKGVKGEYETQLSQARRDIDLPGMREEMDEIQEALMGQRGAYEIASATSGIQMAKQEALQNLDMLHQSGQITTAEYQARREATSAQFNQQIVGKGQEISDQKTQQWLGASVVLNEQLTQAKTALTGVSANLYGTMVAGVTGLSAQLNQALKHVMDSVAAEGNYINTAIGTAGGIATATAATRQAAADTLRGLVDIESANARHFGTMLADAEQHATDLIWSGIQNDNRVRAIAMVDGPNAVLSEALQYGQAIESNYTSILMQTLNMEAAFAQSAIDMTFAFSPHFATMGPFIQQYLGGMQNAFDTQLALSAEQRAQEASSWDWGSFAGDMSKTAVSAVGAFT